MSTLIAPMSLVAPVVVPQAENALPIIGQPYIYVLPTFDRTRQKIGRSIDPLGRIAGLLTKHPEIDLERAVIISVDALSVEKIIHTTFEFLRNPLQKRVDGYTEWFDGDFVDEVIRLCGTVSEYRGYRISVTRNLPEALRAYLRVNPAHTLSTPRLSSAERAVRSQFLIERMAELAEDSAKYCLEVMAERPLARGRDKVGQHYLIRDFDIDQELPCYVDGGVILASSWGRRLRDASDVHITVDGSQAVFHLVKPPMYQQIAPGRLREVFRIAQGPHELSPLGSPDISGHAFAIFWAVARELPEISCGESEQ